MTDERTLTARIMANDPNAVALRHGESSLSYGQLTARAWSLAQQLTALGAGPGASVAIALDRSFDQITGALAALLAGAAYVPLDPEWPEERMQHVLHDADAAVLLARASLGERVRSSAVLLDPRRWSTEGVPGDLIPTQTAEPADLAYIIYTSGSTGVPKGVEITRANLDHLIAWHLEAFKVTAADRATHLAGLGFDASVWEVWPYLAAGACLSLADPMTRNDPAMLQQWLLSERITISFVPTPLAEPLIRMQWPSELPLRFLLTGGDTLHSAPPVDLPFALINNYGPTECTVVATSGLVSAEGEGLPGIGTAIRGTSIYLLDEQGKPVAEGATGEITIGGGGVGAGYRKLPRQTAQSFVPDPFSRNARARMFKTGDMGVRLPDGELSFRGRRDSQEKIRGYRIELDEIVHVLNRHPAVTFSTVAVRNAEAGKTLIAYLVLAEDSMVAPRELQEFASRALPDYMVPATFVRLQAIPLSSNGKVDGRKLPEATAENILTDGASRNPRSETEYILLEMVRGILHSDLVGPDDDFFMAGGHSLLGTQVVLRARETFQVMLTLRDLFEAPTVTLLAQRIEILLLEELEALTEEEAIELARHGSEDGRGV